MPKILSESAIRLRIIAIRQELETRHKTGIIKMAIEGVPIPTQTLQDKLFNLIYRLSKVED